MLVYSKVEAQQTLQFLVSLNAETGGSIQGACLLVMAQRPAQLLGLPVTRSFIFIIKNSPDQVAGYLDNLQPLFAHLVDGLNFGSEQDDDIRR
jgi:hypothetical protein